MKKESLVMIKVLFVSLLLLLIPAMIQAQSEETLPASRAIAPPLVREGAFAVKLGVALGVGTTVDEVEAEDQLSDIGILPKNGWMADYPVTPDIAGELLEAVGAAADANKLSVGKDEALKRLNTVNTEVSLSLSPAYADKKVENVPSGSDDFPNPSVVNNYYYNEGPPVVAYYAPPPDYSYLYAWVPYPFWWTNIWFPGYFMLRDFHRTFFVNSRPIFISNHFRDTRVNRVYRIDPVERFRGRASTGIGVTHTRGSISSAVPRGEGKIFNGPNISNRGSGMMSTPPRGQVTAPSYRGGLNIRSFQRGSGMVSPAFQAGVTARPASHPAVTAAPPDRGSGMVNRPSSIGGGHSRTSQGGGGGWSGSPARGGGGFSGRGHR
jgi:hypothetical protein